MNERTFFSLSAITNRVQQILQPYIGKLFWVKAEISSGRERGGSFYCDLVETKDSGEIKNDCATSFEAMPGQTPAIS
jgi:exodeoxyribonuclease VII large subunit